MSIFRYTKDGTPYELHQPEGRWVEAEHEEFPLLYLPSRNGRDYYLLELANISHMSCGMGPNGLVQSNWMFRILEKRIDNLIQRFKLYNLCRNHGPYPSLSVQTHPYLEYHELSIGFFAEILGYKEFSYDDCLIGSFLLGPHDGEVVL